MENGFKYLGTELNALTEARNYYHRVLACFAPFLGKRIIEVGAGIGTFSALLLEKTEPLELTLIEPTENLFPILRQRFAGNPRVKLIQNYLESLTGTLSADSIILVNVLEHIADDDGLLRAARQILVSGGRIFLFVPAVPQIYGSMDRAFDHFRRYTKPLLAEKLTRAGFEVETLRYFNFLGVFAWFLAGRIMKRTTLLPRDVRLYDRCVVPWALAIERRWEPPIGQSLLAIARK